MCVLHVTSQVTFLTEGLVARWTTIRFHALMDRAFVNVKMPFALEAFTTLGTTKLPEFSIHFCVCTHWTRESGAKEKMWQVGK